MKDLFKESRHKPEIISLAKIVHEDMVANLSRDLNISTSLELGDCVQAASRVVLAEMLTVRFGHQVEFNREQNKLHVLDEQPDLGDGGAEQTVFYIAGSMLPNSLEEFPRKAEMMNLQPKMRYEAGKFYVDEGTTREPYEKDFTPEFADWYMQGKARAYAKVKAMLEKFNIEPEDCGFVTPREL